MVLILLVLVGLVAGSFVNALVWRLHEQAKKSSARRTDLSLLRGRSMCTQCRHQLAAADLIPVVSWVALRGKCRYCHTRISWQYPAVELATAGLFGLSYAAWPYPLAEFSNYALFVTWLAALVLAIALVVYDLHWMLLPNRLVYPFGAVAAVAVAIDYLRVGEPGIVWSALVGSLCFGGLFYVIYQVSRGKWIGGGDVRLGFILGLLLGWQKAILGLTAAAYLGTAVIVILLLAGKYRRNLKLPFGPFLLSGAVIAMLWGQTIIDWYLRISGL